jgi:hypothetical protein
MRVDDAASILIYCPYAPGGTAAEALRGPGARFEHASAVVGWGLHSFPFQLNLSSSVHYMTQLNS